MPKQVLRGGLLWRLEEELADRASELLCSEGLRLDQWLADGRALLVKQTPHRTVYRVQLPQLDLYIKHYRGEWRDWPRRLFRLSRARREYLLGQAVAQRGVPTPQVLGCGEGELFGSLDSFLISRTVPDAVCLLDYLQENQVELSQSPAARWRQDLATAIGQLLAQLHQAGVQHQDLHAGNILLRLDKKPELFLIDLGYVQLGPPLDWRTARDNLSMLDHWFAPRWSRTDRRRACRAYCQVRSDLPLTERQVASEVEQLTQAWQLGQVAHQVRRCFGGNRHFRRITGPSGRGVAACEVEPAALQRLLADSEGAFVDPENRRWKHSATSSVIEITLPVAGRLRPVILRRVPSHNWKTWLAGLFRPSAVLRSYQQGFGLRLRGLPTPRPLAFWQRRWLGLPVVGYSLQEMLPQSADLRNFLLELAQRPAPERLRRQRQVIQQLAELVRALHLWQLSHRDLKGANLMVSPQSWTIGARGLVEVEPDLVRPRDYVWFVDLGGIRAAPGINDRRRVRDLARLLVSFMDHPQVSRTDCLRFLRSYLPRREYGRGRWKIWWKAVKQAAQEKVARNRRLGRIIG